MKTRTREERKVARRKTIKAVGVVVFVLVAVVLLTGGAV